MLIQCILEKMRFPRSKDFFLIVPHIGIYIIFFIIPIGLMLIVSFYQNGTDSFTLENYITFLTKPIYQFVILRTLGMAALVNIFCLALGYPLAYFITKSKYQGILTMMIMVPLLVSIMVRTFGWMVLLGRTGIINSTLMSLGIISDPIPLLYNMNGVILAMVHVLLPFMVLSLIAVLGNIDKFTVEAAQNLGAGSIRRFMTIILPLSMPGIIAGSSLILSLAIAFFATPALIGGASFKVLATLIYSEIMDYFNWSLAAAMSVVSVIIVLVVIFSLSKIIQIKYKGVFK